MRSYKLVVMGSGEVGKTSLTVQFVKSHFTGIYDPTIEDGYTKLVNVDGIQCITEIIDTAGNEQFTAMRDLTIQGGQGFLLVYSITSQDSFNDVAELKEKISRVKYTDNVSKRVSYTSDWYYQVPMILVGNKCDLKEYRVVGKSEAKHLATEWGINFLETSALKNINVQEIFIDLVRQIQKVNPQNFQNYKILHRKQQEPTMTKSASCCSFFLE